MLVLTLIVISVLFIISYLVFDKDFLAPPTAVALVFLFGGFCCFYNEQKWGLDFSPKSLGLIAAGIIATMLGGIIGTIIVSSSRSGRLSFSMSHEITEPNEISVSPIKTVIVIAFQCIALLLIFRHIQKVSGASNWMTAVSRYRALTGKNADVNDLSIRMSTLTKNIGQMSRMLAVVYAYIVGNNFIASKKKISLSWIPVIIYSITTFMQGDRSGMIRLWLEIMVVAYMIHRRKVGWRSSRETRKIITRMAIAIILLGVVFASVRELVGRDTNWDPFYYVTFYAGSPTAILDQIVSHPIVKPDVWGQRTFYYLNQSLTAFFGWPGPYNFYYDWYYSPNGSVIGNAPTAFAPAYKEFGFFGFFILMMGFGIFFTALYCKCRTKTGKSQIDFRLLVFSYIAYVFLMYFYSTFFDFLSHVFIKFMIELLLIRWFLVDWRLRLRRMSIILCKKDRLYMKNNMINSGGM